MTDKEIVQIFDDTVVECKTTYSVGCGWYAGEIFDAVVRHPKFGEFTGEFTSVHGAKVNALWNWFPQTYSLQVRDALKASGRWS